VAEIFARVPGSPGRFALPAWPRRQSAVSAGAPTARL